MTDFTHQRVVDRTTECQRLLQVLRETFERRFRPDEVVERAMDNLGTELELLQINLKSK